MIGNPSNCLRRAGGRRRFFFWKPTCLFWTNVCLGQQLTIFIHIWKYLLIFGQHWGPQIPPTAGQAAAGVLFLNDMPFFRKARFGQPKPCLRLNRWPQTLFLRRITCLFEKGSFLLIFINLWSIFVMVNICKYLSRYGTAYVPTYYTVLRTYLPTLRYCSFRLKATDNG